MTPYEQILDLYLKLQENYMKLPSDIDEQEVSIIIDEINVMTKKSEEENKVYIDDIMGF